MWKIHISDESIAKNFNIQERDRKRSSGNVGEKSSIIAAHDCQVHFRRLHPHINAKLQSRLQCEYESRGCTLDYREKSNKGNVKKWRTNDTDGQIGNYNLTHIRNTKGRNDTAVYLFLFP
ncbi:uncharacterized protein LOC126853790 [Cataglyphis hispanica]|uniref:uncharacterized protein LOC126853790 n=1 Tax=Cataglyphis hispanica TaxID=1086592 RepID=UPI00217F9523|nr:uncharacterized protein LOC126853790 [Cataglyphis hispanica]